MQYVYRDITQAQTYIIVLDRFLTVYVCNTFSEF